MKETWQALRGPSAEVHGEFTIESGPFTADESGIKVPPTPGATITIKDRAGHAVSFRVVGGMCADVARVIMEAHTCR